MNKTNSIFLLLFIWCCSSAYAKDHSEYNTNLITQEMKVDAHAVVRLSSTHIEISSQKELNVKTHNVITLLDSDGHKLIDLSAFYSNSRRLKNIKATTYDAYGKEIKKYSKGKFLDHSLSNGYIFATDSRLKVLDLHPHSYPITISFELEYVDETTAFIPSWLPIRYYGCSIEKSYYSISKPSFSKYILNEKNLSEHKISKKVQDNRIEYTLKNQPALNYETKMPPQNTLFPEVSITLNNFSYKGVQGEAMNYKELGKWYYNSFIQNHFSLSTEIQARVKELVKGEEDPIKKARILYHYLQNNTRYVCVTIDKGGIEPEKAEKVAQQGYGDCKGLSNYMKAMLDVVGVPSYHTLISSGENNDIDTSKVQLGGNHMILNIPNQGKDIWLECTSSDGAFGFVQRSIRNKNVIIIKPEGGVLSKTPQFPDSTNILKTVADVIIDKSGTASVDYKRTSTDLFYGYYYDLPSYKKKNQTKFYMKNWKNIPNLSIENISYNHDSIHFNFSENLKLKIPDFFTHIGETNGIHISKLSSFDHYTPKYRHRKYPIEVSNGVVYNMKMTFHLPKENEFKSSPKDVDFKTKYGSYHRHIKIKDPNTIIIERVIELYRETYSADEYSSYRSFIEKIESKENIILAI
ncbi:DUF3857 and transglutaminase domain-containing protein [Halosquirtibacter xylanolyticus]|uniref:DUF3857 domain-containing protein n=1 Tax=Halosquirtibacter xylanolyticus TaxID=3374599 RepID=UPI0037492DE1|nr:DUF3857 and transglutaminase domain-containing protein [Prolixibacteraceae bacterium]